MKPSDNHLNVTQQEALEKLLSGTLSRAIDFIKFAEAKNAALLTFASAWILAICNLLANSKALPTHYETAFSLCLPFFVASALVAMLAFWPRLRLSSFMKTDQRDSNLLYFGDIAILRLPDFRSQLGDRYIPSNADKFTIGYLDDLTGQVFVTSRIARRKFILFNIGSGLAVAAIFVLAVPVADHVWEVIKNYVR